MFTEGDKTMVTRFSIPSENESFLAVVDLPGLVGLVDPRGGFSLPGFSFFPKPADDKKRIEYSGNNIVNIRLGLGISHHFIHHD